MWKFMKRLLISLYIQLTGVRFYTTIFQPETSDIRNLVIRTVHDYEIEFKFYKETIRFSKYSLWRLRQSDNIVFVVAGVYGENAPESIKKYAGVKMYVNAPSLWFLDEEIITEVLLEAYIDMILLEIRETV